MSFYRQHIYLCSKGFFWLTYDLLGLENGARFAGERNFKCLHGDNFHDRIICINAGHIICKLNVQKEIWTIIKKLLK